MNDQFTCGYLRTPANAPFAIAFFLCLLSLTIGLPAAEVGSPAQPPPHVSRPIGVCPPFPLRDEAGAIIHPAAGLNASQPHSPKQTCGAKGCHDYARITEGFHFTQGKGEAMPPEAAARYPWASAPGNYGGNWCSPAPLYRQLAPKSNKKRTNH